MDNIYIVKLHRTETNYICMYSKEKIYCNLRTFVKCNKEFNYANEHF